MEKSISELAKDVYNARTNPGMLSDVHITLATIFANMNEQMMETQLEKADFWRIKDHEFDMKVNEKIGEDGISIVFIQGNPPVKRDKPLSDTAVEMMWLQTEAGKKEIKLKYTLRSLEKLMQACKSSMVNSAIEAKNI